MNLLVLAIFLILVIVYLYQQTAPTPEEEEEVTYDVAKARKYLDSLTPPPRKLTVRPPVKHMLSLAEGGQLEQVYYVLANYPYNTPKFDAFHIFDLAILMQFSNGLWINWIFEEFGEVGPEFQLTFRDMRQELKAESLFRFENVTDAEEWKPLIGMTLSQASPIYSSYDHGAPRLTDLVLQFGEKEVTICAIPEPDPERLPEIEDFSLSNDWAVVVFDQELMREHGRGKYGPSPLDSHTR